MCFLEVLTCLGVFIRKHVIGKRGCVSQTLQDRVEKTGIAKVLETSSNSMGLLPLQTNLLCWKKNLLWWSDAIVYSCQTSYIFKVLNHLNFKIMLKVILSYIWVPRRAWIESITIYSVIYFMLVKAVSVLPSKELKDMHVPWKKVKNIRMSQQGGTSQKN